VLNHKNGRICWNNKQIHMVVLITTLLLVITPPVLAATFTGYANGTYGITFGLQNDTANFTTLRNGVGSQSEIPTSQDVGLWADTTSGIYSAYERAIISFDISELPSNAVINSATVQIYGDSKNNGLGSPNLSLIYTNPVNPVVSFYATDYNRTNFTRVANDITYASFNTDDTPNTFTLNQLGLALINKTNGRAIYMLDFNWSTDNHPPTWNASQNSVMTFATDMYAPPTHAYVPVITINYSQPVKLFTSQFGADSNPTGDPTGGGYGFSTIYTSGNASITNTSTNASQLIGALSAAHAGDVIFIPPTANINLTGKSKITIPAGVTLASDRGNGGSAGGRIFRQYIANETPDSTLANVSTLYIEGNNVTITGLRLEGSFMSNASLTDNNQMRDGIVMANYKWLTVSNCEIYGWVAGIYINQWSHPEMVTEGLGTTEIGSTIANIHHNYIHNTMTEGFGYAIQNNGAQVLIKANIFDYFRHAVASGGSPGEGYEASYNIAMGNNTNTVFDMHGLCTAGVFAAGSLVRVHHNTKVGSAGYFAQVRAAPLIGASYYFNSYSNCTTGCYHTDGSTPDGIMQYDGTGNMSVINNDINGVFSVNGTIGHETPGWASC
jgi:hypothetical protein